MIKCGKFPVLVRVSSLAVALVLCACATMHSLNTENSAERAQARWDSLLSGDLDGAYQFLSPGYRSAVSSLQYQRAMLGKKVQWVAARVSASECSESSCKVLVSLDFEIYGALPGVPKFEGSQEVSENWVNTDGQWWLVPRD